MVRFLKAPVVAVVALMVMLVGCGSKTDELATIPDYVVIPNQGTLGPATQTVTQTDGSTWAYANPAPGRITILFFGYTSCPDECPTTMAHLASALRKLPADVSDRVWVEMVSTDPDRDTPERLSSWLEQFSPTFHGGRGPISEVIAAAQAYGVGLDAPEHHHPGDDYEVTHGTQVLILNSQGAAVGYYRELAGVSAYVTGIPILVRLYT